MSILKNLACPWNSARPTINKNQNRFSLKIWYLFQVSAREGKGSKT